jgi:hypothetical protein
MVLNVTNLSDRLADLTTLRGVAGPDIYTIGTGYGAVNPIVEFDLESGFHMGWYEVWEPYQSRLIALTGSVGMQVMNVSMLVSMLASNSIYLYGSATGHPYGGGLDSTGYSLKYVRLEAFGTEFLYNDVLSANQRWLLDQNGIDVSIVTIT